MTIANVLQGKPQVVTVAPDTRVADVVALLAERRIGAVPVMDGARVAGVFSERDVIIGLATGGAATLERAVGEVMTSPAVTVAPGDTAIAALALMTRRRIRHLPVLDGDVLVGVVSIGDLVKHRIERIEADADSMRAYITQA